MQCDKLKVYVIWFRTIASKHNTQLSLSLTLCPIFPCITFTELNLYCEYFMYSLLKTNERKSIHIWGYCSTFLFKLLFFFLLFLLLLCCVNYLCTEEGFLLYIHLLKFAQVSNYLLLYFCYSLKHREFYFEFTHV